MHGSLTLRENLTPRCTSNGLKSIGLTILANILPYLFSGEEFCHWQSYHIILFVYSNCGFDTVNLKLIGNRIDQLN